MLNLGFMALLVVAILVAGGFFVSRYVFALLAIFVLVSVLIFVWAVFVPVAVPVPPFRSALRDALERSNAKIQETEKNNITANSEDIATFFPDHPTLAEAEGVLRNEGFSCGTLQRWADMEIARWGKQYRRFKTCMRRTYFHPFGSFGWEIYLFANEVDVIESMKARRYYDGL